MRGSQLVNARNCGISNSSVLELPELADRLALANAAVAARIGRLLAEVPRQYHALALTGRKQFKQLVHSI